MASVIAVVVLGAIAAGIAVASNNNGSHNASKTLTPARRRAERAAAPTSMRGAAFIRAENAKPGSNAWMITNEDPDHRPIEGWVSDVSGQPGDTVGLYITTAAPSYHVEAYRMGWYAGSGGRLIWRSPELPGHVQPPCNFQQPTKTVDCSNWTRSLPVTIGHDWPPGEYLFMLVTNTGGRSYVPFTVRDDASRSAILVVNSVTTWQAYNAWGGHSLYGDESFDASQRSYVVSFDRPYLVGTGGSGHFFQGTYEFVQEAESLGLDVSYTTSVDVDEHPELLRQHKVIVSMAHDEYYSQNMRSALEQAQGAGRNIIFLGANAIYRRIRLQPSPIGPDRIEVNYREASLDPLNGVNPAQVTTSWREDPDPRPESALIGEMFECDPVSADMVFVNTGEWMFAGTGITNGEHFPDVVGNEYDRVMPEAPTPPNIEVLAHSPLTCRGYHSYSDMSYYTAPSGGSVLATGSIYFERHLGALCPDSQLATNTDCQLRKMIANVVAVFDAGPAGRTHPSRNNLAEFGIRPGYVNAPTAE